MTANATVKSEGLNLHASPSALARIIDQLARGDGLYVIEERKGWLKVNVERTNQVGWVDGNYVVVNIMPLPQANPSEPAPPIRPSPYHYPPVDIPDDIPDHSNRWFFAAAGIIVLVIVILWLSHASGAELLLIPDDTITPGVVRDDLTVKDLCRIRWGRDNRHVTPLMRGIVFASYALTPDDASCQPDRFGRRFEIDHRLPRSLGGADDISNLWPQCYSGTWGAVRKDRLEVRVHRDLCNRLISVKSAQGVFLRDWREGYVLYFGQPH